uniref:CSON004672 protein n=1 Tax=Culicoides sonorensis TaxID=179676 RepID=A0A336LU92_CULSO
MLDMRRCFNAAVMHQKAYESTYASVAWNNECEKYRQTRFSSRRVRKRVIFKSGDCNVVQGNVAKRRRRYLQDIFTTLVDIKWRWTIFVFALNFILSWLIFAVLWYLIAYSHGDFDWIHNIRDSALHSANKTTYIPCVTELYGFTSTFLFSLESQHTIGYGHRYVTEQCPEAVFLLCLQSITGVFTQAFMVGIVFAKLSRPKKRAQTLLFSRNAVICHRDGVPCLMFRVGDMRKSHIIEAHVRAQIIRRKVTREGEVLGFYQQELQVGADGSDDRLMFIWPTTIVHKIDKQSPLYALSAQDMIKERFEIVVMLEGVVESTGMTTQARSSYLPSEILWGHRFESMISFKKETGEYEVDYTLFNNTYEVDTPLCSSRQLDEVKAELHTPNGLDRLYSSHQLIPRAHSAVSLETPSSETASVDSSNRRHNSIPNGNLLGTGGHNHFTDCIGSGTITNLYSMDRSPHKDITTITISNCSNDSSNNNNNNNNSISTPNNNDNNTTNNNLSANNLGTKKNSNRRLSIKEPSDSETGEYEVDYTLFNNTYEVDTPLCSSRQLDEVKAELHTPNGLDRLYSSHQLIPRAHSAVSLETPSSETASVDSSNRRHNSIPNGNLLGTGGHNHFTDCIGSGTITNLYSMDRSPHKDITTITISNCSNDSSNNNNNNNNSISTPNNNDNNTTNNNLSANNLGTKKNSNRRLSIKEPSDSVC